MDPNTYALYIKSGWHTMACVTPRGLAVMAATEHEDSARRIARAAVSAAASPLHGASTTTAAASGSHLVHIRCTASSGTP